MTNVIVLSKKFHDTPVLSGNLINLLVVFWIDHAADVLGRKPLKANKLMFSG